jgi:hypothetical protein
MYQQQERILIVAGILTASLLVGLAVKSLVNMQFSEAKEKILKEHDNVRHVYCFFVPYGTLENNIERPCSVDVLGVVPYASTSHEIHCGHDYVYCPDLPFNTSNSWDARPRIYEDCWLKIDGCSRESICSLVDWETVRKEPPVVDESRMQKIDEKKQRVANSAFWWTFACVVVVCSAVAIAVEKKHHSDSEIASHERRRRPRDDGYAPLVERETHDDENENAVEWTLQ